MPHPKNRTSFMTRINDTSRLKRQVAEINAVVPDILSRRLTRLAYAGVAPSRSDRSEMSRMSSEKWQAASQSAAAMAAFAMHQQMVMAQAFWQAVWAPWLGVSSAKRLPSTNPVVGLLSAGIAPYHRIATANARRLRKR